MATSWRPAHCDHGEGIVLGAVIGYQSPCRCKRCYEELDPDAMLDGATLRALLTWAHHHRRLLRLTVEEDDAGDAARAELDDRASAVNGAARDLVSRINRIQPCWYWVRGGHPPQPEACPWCRAPVEHARVGPSEVWQCDACRIVTVPKSVAEFVSPAG